MLSQSRPFFYRFVSAWLCFSLVWSLPVPAYALPSAETGFASSVLDPTSIRIPENLGKVEESFKGASGKLVFYIQDAHTNYSAQKNIAAIVDKLVSDYGIRLVTVEAAEGDIETNLFRSFPISEVSERVMDRFMRKGEIGGPQYASITGKTPFEFVGIDKAELYKENLSQFLSVLADRESGDSFVKKAEQGITQLKTVLYSKEARELDRLIETHTSQFTDLLSFLNRLRAKANELDVLLDDYAHLGKLMEYSEKLKAKDMPEETVREEFKSVDPILLFNEIEHLSFELKYKLAENDEARRLIRLERYLTLLKHGFSLELTREDAARLKGMQKNFERDKIISFMESISKRHKLDTFYLEKMRSVPLDDYTARIFRFYDGAAEREKEFEKRLKKEMLMRFESSAVLVTGGYHREGILKRLKEAGVSYAVITPVIDGLTDHEKYLELMRASGQLLSIAPGTNNIGLPVANYSFGELSTRQMGAMLSAPYDDATQDELARAAVKLGIVLPIGADSPEIASQFWRSRIFDLQTQSNAIVVGGRVIGFGALSQTLVNVARRGGNVESKRRDLLSAVSHIAIPAPSFTITTAIPTKTEAVAPATQPEPPLAGFGAARYGTSDFDQKVETVLQRLKLQRSDWAIDIDAAVRGLLFHIQQVVPSEREEEYAKYLSQKLKDLARKTGLELFEVNEPTSQNLWITTAKFKGPNSGGPVLLLNAHIDSHVDAFLSPTDRGSHKNVLALLDRREIGNQELVVSEDGALRSLGGMNLAADNKTSVQAVFSIIETMARRNVPFGEIRVAFTTREENVMVKTLFRSPIEMSSRGARRLLKNNRSFFDGVDLIVDTDMPRDEHNTAPLLVLHRDKSQGASFIGPQELAILRQHGQQVMEVEAGMATAELQNATSMHGVLSHVIGRVNDERYKENPAADFIEYFRALDVDILLGSLGVMNNDETQESLSVADFVNQLEALTRSIETIIQNKVRVVPAGFGAASFVGVNYRQRWSVTVVSILMSIAGLFTSNVLGNQKGTKIPVHARAFVTSGVTALGAEATLKAAAKIGYDKRGLKPGSEETVRKLQRYYEMSDDFINRFQALFPKRFQEFFGKPYARLTPADRRAFAELLMWTEIHESDLLRATAVYNDLSNAVSQAMLMPMTLNDLWKKYETTIRGVAGLPSNFRKPGNKEEWENVLKDNDRLRLTMVFHAYHYALRIRLPKKIKLNNVSFGNRFRSTAEGITGRWARHYHTSASRSEKRKFLSRITLFGPDAHRAYQRYRSTSPRTGFGTAIQEFTLLDKAGMLELKPEKKAEFNDRVDKFIARGEAIRSKSTQTGALITQDEFGALINDIRVFITEFFTQPDKVEKEFVAAVDSIAVLSQPSLSPRAGERELAEFRGYTVHLWIAVLDNLRAIVKNQLSGFGVALKGPKLGPTRPDLEDVYKKQVEAKTPGYVKRNRLFNIADSKGEVTVTLKREHLQPYDAVTNPEGLGLWKWLEDYEKEAKIATAGIRLTQNILYPWDTRNRISEVGIAFATLAKALVSKERFPDHVLEKFAGGEVRYNTAHYIELIARIQAAQGIRTFLPTDRKTIPIWMASFLIFINDWLGGEHGTSSHANSSFMATKDLDDQGSQYLPEVSSRFVNKIREIFQMAERDGKFEFKIAANDNPLIDTDFMHLIDDGVKLYVDYLKKGVATDVNIKQIKAAKRKIIIDNVGGSMYRMMPRIFGELGINDKFEWFHTGEDPFFHGIGKYLSADGEFFDFTQDTTIMKRDKKTGELTSIPVMERMGYDTLLKDKEIGTTILMTDPDGDRLVLAQIESAERAEFLRKVGVDFLILDEKRIVALYTPNQSFFLTMAHHAEALKAAGKWDEHPRFIIMTTASSAAWREWAEKNGIKVIMVPVGFKEIAAMMKKIEAQMQANPNKEVIVHDAMGRTINLGVQPRLLFAGEESGGMIIGPDEPIKSKGGRMAIAMREKSAGEALVIQAAMTARFESENRFFSDYLDELFTANDIKGKYDVRHDKTFYNQSNPDPVALAAEKTRGEELRTKNYLFYLSMDLAYQDKKISKENIIEILNDVFGKDGLNFDDLKEIYFVGDGVFFEFPNKVLEIRPSGTDAKSKSYAMGDDKMELARFAQALGEYSGDITDMHRKHVAAHYVEKGMDLAYEIYDAYYRDGLPPDTYEPRKLVGVGFGKGAEIQGKETGIVMDDANLYPEEPAPGFTFKAIPASAFQQAVEKLEGIRKQMRAEAMKAISPEGRKTLRKNWREWVLSWIDFDNERPNTNDYSDVVGTLLDQDNKLLDQHKVIQKIIKVAENIRARDGQWNEVRAWFNVGIGGSTYPTHALVDILNGTSHNDMPYRLRGAPKLLYSGDSFSPEVITGKLIALEANGELFKTIFNIISKSGITAETAGAYLIIREWLRMRLAAVAELYKAGKINLDDLGKLGLSIDDIKPIFEVGDTERKQPKFKTGRFFVVTTGFPEKEEGGSALYKSNYTKYQSEDGTEVMDPFFAMLPVPIGTGGRFSTFPVALLPLAVTANKLKNETPHERVYEAVRGAKAAFKEYFAEPEVDITSSIPFRTALINYLAEHQMPGAVQKRILDIYGYDQELKALADLADELHNEGVVKFGRGLEAKVHIGPNENHLSLEGMTQRPGDRMAWFWQVGTHAPLRNPVIPGEVATIGGIPLGQMQEFSALGTQRDFSSRGLLNYRWVLPQKSAFHVGAFIYALQTQIAVLGRMTDMVTEVRDDSTYVDYTYLQPGVEGYKQQTHKLLLAYRDRLKGQPLYKAGEAFQGIPMDIDLTILLEASGIQVAGAEVGAAIRAEAGFGANIKTQVDYLMQLNGINPSFVAEQLSKWQKHDNIEIQAEEELPKKLEQFLRREGEKTISVKNFSRILNYNRALQHNESDSGVAISFNEFFKDKIFKNESVTLNEVFQFLIAQTSMLPITDEHRRQLIEEVYPIILLSFVGNTRKFTDTAYTFHLLGVTLLTVENIITDHILETQTIEERPQWAMDMIIAALYHDLLEDTAFSPLNLQRYVSRKALQRIQALTKTKLLDGIEGIPSELKAKLDKRINKDSYQRIRLGPKSLVAKYADVLFNMSDAFIVAEAGAEQTAFREKFIKKITGEGGFLDEMVYHVELPSDEAWFIELANNFLANLEKITGDSYRKLPAVGVLKATSTNIANMAREKFSGLEDSTQLVVLKNILQDKAFARQMAERLHSVYFEGIGESAPPLIVEGDSEGVIKEKIAMNLAGFYALESGIGVLRERSGGKKTVLDILHEIMNGTLPEKDMLLLARFANATWKAGQPFRSLDRITRDTFRPAVLLTDDELAKDFAQIRGASEKLAGELRSQLERARIEQSGFGADLSTSDLAKELIDRVIAQMNSRVALERDANPDLANLFEESLLNFILNAKLSDGEKLAYIGHYDRSIRRQISSWGGSLSAIYIRDEFERALSYLERNTSLQIPILTVKSTMPISISDGIHTRTAFIHTLSDEQVFTEIVLKHMGQDRSYFLNGRYAESPMKAQVRNPDNKTYNTSFTIEDASGTTTLFVNHVDLETGYLTKNPAQLEGRSVSIPIARVIQIEKTAAVITGFGVAEESVLQRTQREMQRASEGGLSAPDKTFEDLAIDFARSGAFKAAGVYAERISNPDKRGIITTTIANMQSARAGFIPRLTGFGTGVAAVKEPARTVDLASKVLEAIEARRPALIADAKEKLLTAMRNQFGDSGVNGKTTLLVTDIESLKTFSDLTKTEGLISLANSVSEITLLQELPNQADLNKIDAIMREFFPKAVRADISKLKVLDQMQVERSVLLVGALTKEVTRVLALVPKRFRMSIISFQNELSNYLALASNTLKAVLTAA